MNDEKPKYEKNSLCAVGNQFTDKNKRVKSKFVPLFEVSYGFGGFGGFGGERYGGFEVG